MTQHTIHLISPRLQRERRGRIARMKTTEEADGLDLDNDEAMNGLIARSRAILTKAGRA